LIEQHAGTMPVWLSPVQIVVMNIASRHEQYAEKISTELEKQGFRVKKDLRNEKIGFKIREHSMQRVPYLLIVGDKELENNTVAVRTQKGEDLGSLSVDELSRELMNVIESKK